MTTPKQYKLGKITNNYAWVIAKRLGPTKSPPYRGYVLDLENGQQLTHRLDGFYYVEQATAKTV